ncbi:hypothetical protein ACFYRC_35005 [Streptomyces sp. NPDC005279]|uniref:hypothetical protein n=1 Tax=Streptomyces sp. NPDC005279 TaxID=3364712 RepID=UPI0036CCC4CD
MWDEERTDDAEGRLAAVGQHLGFTSTGPDNLWALCAERHAVTELRTGCTTDTIVKKDLDQLGGSVRWDQEQHPGVTSLACERPITKPSDSLEGAAGAPSAVAHCAVVCPATEPSDTRRGP